MAAYWSCVIIDDTITAKNKSFCDQANDCDDDKFLDTIVNYSKHR